MLEIFDYPLAVAFERDAENALTSLHLIRMMSSHVSKKCVNSGKPDITCRHRVLAILLQVVEKSQNPVRFKILQIQVRIPRPFESKQRNRSRSTRLSR